MAPVLVIVNVSTWRDTRVTDLVGRGPMDVRCADADDPIPTDPTGYRGVIIGGGVVPLSTPTAAMRDQLALIEAVLRDGTPYLGICLGAQLLAHALGAAVRGGPPEVGYCALEATSTELASLDRVFQWHWEGFDLPDGAERLARSADYDTQAMRYGRAYGFQFHPDVRARDVPGWLDMFPTETSRVEVATQLALAERHDPAVATWFEEHLTQTSLAPAAVV